MRAGDVAGGCPQKYVTGALAEGKLAALDMVKQFKAGTLKEADIQTETEIKGSGRGNSFSVRKVPK